MTLEPKRPYVMSNPRYNNSPLGDDFVLTAPIHVHLFCQSLPFIRSAGMIGASTRIEMGWITEDKVDDAWYRIYSNYDTDAAWLATAEAIDAYLEERARGQKFTQVWGSALKDIGVSDE